MSDVCVAAPIRVGGKNQIEFCVGLFRDFG
jgi:hypothetical protein